MMTDSDRSYREVAIGIDHLPRLDRLAARYRAERGEEVGVQDLIDRAIETLLNRECAIPSRRAILFRRLDAEGVESDEEIYSALVRLAIEDLLTMCERLPVRLWEPYPRAFPGA